MRILTLSLLMAVVAVNFSCKKEEEPEPEPVPTPIVIIPNMAPIVALTAPTEGQTFLANSISFLSIKRTSAPFIPIPLAASVDISATASDSDGTIAKVNFYSGNTLLNSDTEAPYSYTHTFGVGSHTIKARAFDNDNDSTDSQEIDFTVSSVPVSL